MKKAQYYIIGVALIALALIVKLVFFQNEIPKQLNNYVIPELNLDDKAGYLVNELKQDTLTIEVAQYNHEPLMDQIIVNYIDREEPEELAGFMPWFYYSPNVQKLSPMSFAQRVRLIEKEPFNQFEWYAEDGDLVLYQAGKPYTGWYSTDFEGWIYFDKGFERVDNKLSNKEVADILREQQLLTALSPIGQNTEFYYYSPTQYIDVVEETSVAPHILYKDKNNLIFTAPPGTLGSLLLTNTSNYVDIPMEVVKEVKTSKGEWLQVDIGYDTLGWIEKDDTYTSYVPTYYSEKELLDTIEAVLEEEIAGIAANVGASFVNNETMSQIDVNNQVFFPASTQKIYVLGEVYRQYAEEIISPNDVLTLNDWDKVPGAGIIQDYPGGSEFTVDELVDLVMIYSDNTAANMLIDLVGGGDAINPKVHQLGLTQTHIQGKYYMSEGQGFTTSPHDAARYFAYLFNDRLNGEPYDEELINKFFLNSHNFLRNYIPYTTTAWNKSGLGETEQNDVATFITPYGSYTLAIYTSEPAHYLGISDQVGLLSLRVHEVFNELRQQLWITVEN